MDVPSLPNELWIQIASLLDGRSLGRLGCVSVRFATHDVPDPDYVGRLRPAECWRLVDEAARRAFLSRPPYVQAWFTGQKDCSQTRMWLEACSHADAMSAPLVFEPSQCHEGISLSHDNTLATLDTSKWIDGKLTHGYGAAFCRTVMTAGQHYVEFEVTDSSMISMVGVISNAEFLPPRIKHQHLHKGVPEVSSERPTTAAAVRDARAQQAERLRKLAGVYDGVHQTEYGWMICCGGLQRFFLWNDGAHTDYPGMPDFEHYGDQFLDLGASDAVGHEKSFLEGGGLVGLLLDVDKGSLAVYANGRRCGLAVPHGLLPPLQWAIDLFEGEAMKIGGPKSPPSVSAEQMVEEDRTWARVEWKAVLEQRCAMSTAWEALH